MVSNRLLGQVGAAFFVLGALAGIAVAEDEAFRPMSVHQPDVRLGEVVFTLIGQVTNTPPDQSAQYGYLTGIAGMDHLFASPTEDETSAFFTFYTEATTVAVRHNGPMTIVEREGTTTVYYNAVPHASFADPDSFRDGQAVLVMTLKQQVILDSVATAFSVVVGNNVTANDSFEKDGRTWILARRHDNFRWALTGRQNATPPPSGHFAAYVVKVQGD